MAQWWQSGISGCDCGGPQVLGCACPGCRRGLGQVDEPGFNPTRDIVAGAAAFAVPWAYTSFRPKRWPKANLWAQLGMVVGTYFGIRYLYARSSG